jgi:hypothetical protein
VRTTVAARTAAEFHLRRIPCLRMRSR